MNCNSKGNFGLLKVVEDLYKRNFNVFLPFDDYSPVDLIALNNKGRILRLQVKYREPISRILEERYELPASSTINGVKTPINRDLIDGWALYMSRQNDIKYIPVNAMMDKKSLNINPGKDYGNIFGEDSQ